MFKDLTPYASMASSGTTWLGSVPDHWRVTSARSVFAEVGPAGHDGEPLLSVTIGRGVVPQAEVLATTGKKDSSNLDRSKYKLVEPGDIAYNKMRAWQGAVGLSAHRGIVSPAYVVVRPRRDSGAFLHYLLRTPGFVKEAERWSYGITSDQWSLRPEHFKMITFALPGLDEQAAIVKYLTHAHRRIDRAIAAKRKLIALLDEQKQAIITHAVTRGLNPAAPLRDTALEWLGSVPAHWAVVPLKRHWSVRDCKHVTAPFVSDGYPLASVVQAQRFRLDLSDAKCTSSEFFAILTEGGRKPRRGDLIYCRNVAPGMAAIVTDDAHFAMGQDVCLLRSETQSAEYLNFFLRSGAMRRQIDLLAIGSTFTRINVEDVRVLTIVVPPPIDEAAIVDHLQKAVWALDAAIDRARGEIDLLREFRTRLTSDVVTGQLDVRHIAATLPDLDPGELGDDVGAAEDDLVDEAAELLEAVDT